MTTTGAEATHPSPGVDEAAVAAVAPGGVRAGVSAVALRRGDLAGRNVGPAQASAILLLRGGQRAPVGQRTTWYLPYNPGHRCCRRLQLGLVPLVATRASHVVPGEDDVIDEHHDAVAAVYAGVRHSSQAPTIAAQEEEGGRQLGQSLGPVDGQGTVEVHLGVIPK